MQSTISHIQFNVQPAHMQFYKDLMALLGWSTIYSEAQTLGVAGKGNGSLWFNGQVKEVSNDYDGPGMNHLGFGAESMADVDAVAEFLKQRDVPWLFDTPRHRPEFSRSEDQTYYQVMFESPDRILIEVVYTGPKSA
jgi:catechol 2,3-dioxygenase-like lactoylglutathione lyase family enzyme